MKVKGEGSRVKGCGRKLRIMLLACGLLMVVCGLTGCDSFVRKFTRKPKGEVQHVEQVLEPQEYVPPAAREQYRNFILYWQCEQDELINALVNKSSQKKQLGSAREALKNLNNLRALLSPAKQKKLDVYITELDDLKSGIERDAYSNDAANNARSAERIKRLVLKEFSFSKVSADIVASGGEAK